MKSKATKATRQPQSERKVLRTFRLANRKLAAAQRILGTSTATETIEQALELVVFRDELVRGAKALRGIVIDE